MVIATILYQVNTDITGKYLQAFKYRFRPGCRLFNVPTLTFIYAYSTTRINLVYLLLNYLSCTNTKD